MPSPKNGTAPSAVAPTAPVEATEADKADPGEVEEIKAEQRKTQTGKYGSKKVKPYKGPESKEEKEKKKSWIEIEMVDEDDKPVVGEAYQITVPDGSVASGTLDDKGFARLEGFDPGNCKVSFPNLDKDAWDNA